LNQPPAGPFSIAQLEQLTQDILVAAGAAREDAAIVANEVVDAEACGYESQGLLRLESYVASARSSGRKPTELQVLRDAPSAVTWDSTHGWGHVATKRAIEECVRRAKDTGACIGVVRNAGHIGRLGYYAEAAANLGAIGFVACSGNASSATSAPWGGREPRLSTNPFAYGFPHPSGDHVVVDVSTTQAARGKVLVAAATGKTIPHGWAFDATGMPTTDPNSALPPNGTLAPLGGHKGFALSIVVELLCGGLGGHYPPDVSTVFVAAYDPAHVTTSDSFAAAVTATDELMRSSALRPGFDSIRLPGAGAAARRRAAAQFGLTVTAEIWNTVRAAGESLGVALPA
jgi:LDH2 family malate/lactate/ureidoglycolate dehydrogenase